MGFAQLLASEMCFYFLFCNNLKNRKTKAYVIRGCVLNSLKIKADKIKY